MDLRLDKLSCSKLKKKKISVQRKLESNLVPLPQCNRLKNLIILWNKTEGLI